MKALFLSVSAFLMLARPILPGNIAVPQTYLLDHTDNGSIAVIPEEGDAEITYQEIVVTEDTQLPVSATCTIYYVVE